MILSKEEAICLILRLSEKNTVSSTTKLNKLLARLNLFFIPIDFNFSLNKFGSFNAEIDTIPSNNFFTVESYEYEGKECHKYILKKEGLILYENNIVKKLGKIMKQNEFDTLKNEIRTLSKLRASDISENEHKILLLDVDDRFKLEQKLNEVFIDLKDICDEFDSLTEDSISSIKLKALIEYSYYLIKYLREKRFRTLDQRDYDFDAYMFDYYFLYNIGKIVPFLKEQIKDKEKDEILINKYYQYIINSVRGYPFSLDNPNLKDLIAS